MDFIIYKIKIIQPYDIDFQLTLNTVNKNQFNGFVNSPNFSMFEVTSC